MSPGKSDPACAVQSSNFTTTRWTVVLTAAGDGTITAESRDAWEHLCRSYWLPPYMFARRRGHGESDAQDAVQDFFLHLLEGQVIARADRRRGLFRTYLLRCFRNFLANQIERDRTLERGGGISFIPLEALDSAEFDQLSEERRWSPERAYDFGWAHALVGRAAERLRLEAAGRGKQQWFDELRVFLPGGGAAQSKHGDDETNLYQAAAARLDKTAETVRTAVHRLRARFLDRVRKEVARTVETPEEMDAELRHLRAVLSQSAQLGGE